MTEISIIRKEALQNVPRISEILKPFSFFDFLRTMIPARSEIQSTPKMAPNAVSAWGRCGISSRVDGEVGVAVTVVVAVAVNESTDVIVAVAYEVVVTNAVLVTTVKLSLPYVGDKPSSKNIEVYCIWVVSQEASCSKTKTFYVTETPILIDIPEDRVSNALSNSIYQSSWINNITRVDN